MGQGVGVAAGGRRSVAMVRGPVSGLQACSSREGRVVRPALSPLGT